MNRIYGSRLTKRYGGKDPEAETGIKLEVGRGKAVEVKQELE